MAKPMKSSAADYSNQFKPAIQLGAPTLTQWADGFYALQLQDKVDANGDHYLRLGRGASSDPALNSVIQLQTAVPGFTPNYREVEVTGKKGYTALCFEGGTNQLGVFVYLMRSADVGSGATEIHINTRYMPYVMLTDLVVGTTKGGLLEIKLPDADIAKLNVTLRLSPLQEPEFRTFKTEVLFENLPASAQQEIESKLNFQAASIAAFVGYQILGAQGQVSPVSGLGAANGLDLSPTTKAFGVAVLVTVGAVVNVVNAIVQKNPIGGVGAGLAGAGSVYLAWVRFADIRNQAQAVQPQVQPPQLQPVQDV
ncbi:MAG: hypothetical protein ORN49_03980 [Rhodobacteraceae bacterium]|nr:hypothetical protein [Paracoccaceae bacterium]